jgi:hypothetical protein
MIKMFGGALFRLLYETDVRNQVEQSLAEGYRTGNIRRAMYDGLGDAKSHIKAELERIVENAPSDAEVERKAKKRIAQSKSFRNFVYGTMVALNLTILAPFAASCINERIQERKHEAIYQEALEQGDVYNIEDTHYINVDRDDSIDYLRFEGPHGKVRTVEVSDGVLKVREWHKKFLSNRELKVHE